MNFLKNRRFQLESLEERTLLTAAPWSTGDETDYSGLVVTTLEDVIDSSDQMTSIREAIAYAETLGGGAKVTFTDGLEGTITLTYGALTVGANSSITVDGGGVITIDAVGQSRAFEVGAAGAVLSDLSMTGGYHARQGGAVAASGDLLLSNVTVTDSFSGKFGGAVYIAPEANLTVVNSAFTGNTASSHGGGIFIDKGASADISGSYFSGNSTAAYGAAVYVWNDAAAQIANSFFVGNIAPNGTIRNYGGTLDLINVVISRNEQGISGSGGGVTTATNVTISRNTRSAVRGDFGAEFTFYNSILTDGYSLFKLSGGASVGGDVNLSTDEFGTNFIRYNGGDLFGADGYSLWGENQAEGAGDPGYNDTALDAAGKNRYYGGTLDLGALEQIITVTGASRVFNGEYQAPIVLDGPADWILYSEDGENWTETPPARNAGTYTFWVKAGTDSGDEEIYEVSGTITPVQLEVTGSSVVPREYDGSTDALIAIGAVSPLYDDVTITAVGVYDSPEVGEHDVEVTYTVSGENAGNYIAPASETLRGEITNPPHYLLVVTTLDDVSDPYDDVNSLREAIAYAEMFDTAVTVTFAEGLSGTIFLADGAIAFSASGEIAIDGDGRITVEGGGASRVFEINAGEVLLANISITGGYDARYGGAIYNAGNLTLDNVGIADSRSGKFGGAVYTAAGTSLTVIDSFFTDNTASSHGGAIFVEKGAAADIDRSHFSGNSTAAYGAAVYQWNNSTVNITDTFFLNNTAPNGTIRNHGGNLVMTNVVISGNDQGFSSSAGGVNTATNVTISNNFRSAVRGENGATFRFYNSILMNDNDPEIKDQVGVFDLRTGATVGGDVNLSTESFGTNFVEYNGGDLFDSDGWTLAGHNQAMNAGDPAYNDTLTDAVGNNRYYGGGLDLGAVEQIVKAIGASVVYNGEYQAPIEVEGPVTWIRYRSGDEWSDAPTTRDAGTYTIYVMVGTDTPGEERVYEVTGTIMPKPVTLWFNVADRPYDGTAGATVSGYTLAGLVPGDDVTVTVNSASFADKNAGENKAVAVDYTLGGADFGNYTVTVAQTAATITAKELTVIGTLVADKNYDGTTDAAITLGAVSGILDGDDASVAASGAFPSAVPGTYVATVTYTVSGADAANYLVPEPETFSATINAPETPSMHVTTDLDVVDAFDGMISLREALGVYFQTDGTYVFSDDGSFAYGKDLSNVTVTFADDLTEIKANSTFELTDEHDGVMINGVNAAGQANHIVFKGNDFSVFTVSGGIKAAFNNLIFRENAVDGDGAAIRVIAADADITVSGSEFTGNTSVAGGAIFGYDASLTVTGSTFTENTSSVAGGAIYGYGVSLTVSGSTFTGNTSMTNGGAIRGSGGSLTVSDSTFTGNKATDGAGGAIYGDNASLTVTDSTFTASTSSSSGGAIYGDGGSLTVSGSKFTGNKATDGSGGAIFGYDASLTVSDSTFTRNDADTGGAISGYGGSLTVIGSTFAENTSVYYGGAIYDDTDDITVSGSEFTGNKTSNGGAIYGAGGSLTVSDSEFTENSAGTAGAIYVVSGVSLTVNGSTFTENTSSRAGAIFGAGDSLVVNGSTFTKNDSSSDGGAITSYATLVVSGSAFTGNTASTDGGAIYQYGAPLTVTGSEFTGNSAHVSGGAIHADCNLLVDTCLLTENSSAGEGGAIYSSGSVLTVTDSEFTKNNANYGGTIYNSYAALTVADSEFTRNSAERSGGAIYDSSSSVFTLTGCMFSENHAADGSGGAVTTQSQGETVTVTDCEFTGNTSSSEGGAIYRDSSLMVSGSTFTGNTSSSNGGAIYLDTGALTVSGSEFTGNTSSSSGGAIYGDNASLTVSGSTFTGNDSVSCGGAISSYSTLTVSDSTFTENTSFDGGAIYGGAIYVSGSTFAGNSAGFTGGAISAFGDLTVNTSVLTGNVAVSDGGAIEAGVLTVYQSLIADNSAGEHGGGICFAGGANILWSTVAGNSGDDLNLDGSATANVYGSIVLNASVWDSSEVTYTSSLYDRVFGNGTFDVSDPNNYQLQTGDVLFVDGTDPLEAYKLAAGSVAINGTGIRTTTGNPTVDLAGVARPQGGVYDYGAYEWSSDVPETPSMHVTTGLDVVDAFDGLISLREALGAYFQTDGTYTIGDDGSITYGKDSSNVTVTFADGLTEIKANSTFELTDEHDGVVFNGVNAAGQASHILFKGNDFSVFTVSGGIKAAFNNLIFRENVNGGVIYVSAADVDITVSGSEFTGNTSSGDGGAIYLGTGALTVTGCEFTGNSAGYMGGAISSNAVTTVIDSTFTGNTSTYYGGAIFGYRVSLTVSGSTFTENSAEDVGGAIYQSDGNLTVADSIFTGNTSESSGGAICASGTLTVSGSTFAENTSSSFTGGAIYSNAVTTVTDSTFTANTSSSGGGAIYGVDASLTVSASTFTKNSARAGSAISYGGLNSALTVYQSLIADNTAASDGGAIYAHATAGEANILWSTVAGNSGGDLYLYDSATANVYGSIVLSTSMSDSAEVTYTSSLYQSVIGNGTFDVSDPNNYQSHGGDVIFVGGTDPLEAYRLAAGSVAINGTGVTSTTGNPTVDLAGVARPQGGVYDYGAYEYGTALPAELPYGSAADAAFASLDDDDLLADFDLF